MSKTPKIVEVIGCSQCGIGSWELTDLGGILTRKVVRTATMRKVTVKGYRPPIYVCEKCYFELTRPQENK